MVPRVGVTLARKNAVHPDSPYRVGALRFVSDIWGDASVHTHLPVRVWRRAGGYDGLVNDRIRARTRHCAKFKLRAHHIHRGTRGRLGN